MKKHISSESGWLHLVGSLRKVLREVMVPQETVNSKSVVLQTTLLCVNCTVH